MIIYLSLLVALVGLVVYVLSGNPKVTTLALWAYVAGLFAFLLQMGGLRLGAGVH